MEEYFSNFRRYLGNGQRLSIFGKQKEDKLEVFLLKCNPKDEFSRDTAKIVYAAYGLGFKEEDGTIQVAYSNNHKDFTVVLYHPEVVLVPIAEGNSAKYEFKQFCKQFYKKQSITIISSVEKDFLVRDTEQISIK